MIEAKGANGIIVLDGNTLTIQRKGLMSLTMKGDKHIFLDQISAVELKKAGWTAGYISFSFLGGAEDKSWGVYNSAMDENTVMFNSKQQAPFEEIRNQIERYLATKRGGTTNSGVADLEKLSDLKDKGVITAEEFEAKKKQILGL